MSRHGSTRCSHFRRCVTRCLLKNNLDLMGSGYDQSTLQASSKCQPEILHQIQSIWRGLPAGECEVLRAPRCSRLNKRLFYFSFAELPLHE